MLRLSLTRFEFIRVDKVPQDLEFQFADFEN